MDDITEITVQPVAYFHENSHGYRLSFCHLRNGSAADAHLMHEVYFVHVLVDQKLP